VCSIVSLVALLLPVMSDSTFLCSTRNPGSSVSDLAGLSEASGLKGCGGAANAVGAPKRVASVKTIAQTFWEDGCCALMAATSDSELTFGLLDAQSTDDPLVVNPAHATDRSVCPLNLLFVIPVPPGL